MNKMITISREFGSGGRELGRRLSEQLNVVYYDQEIITEIAKRTKLAEQYVEQKPITSFPIHIGRSFYPLANPGLTQRQAVVLEQQRIISEMAEKSDCIIVGRCAEHILRDYNPFRIFVYADMECKIKRCRGKSSDGETMTDHELKQKIMSVDKNRANYYNYCTGKQWGNKLNYDLCINTTQMAIKELVSVLSKLFA